MPNGDAIRDAILPLENKLAELDRKIDAGEDWRKETTRILERLSTIVIGDKEIGHRGLLEKVQEASAFMAAQQTREAEVRGGKKMLVFISAVSGALLGKITDAAVALYSAKGH